MGAFILMLLCASLASAQNFTAIVTMESLTSPTPTFHFGVENAAFVGCGFIMGHQPGDKVMGPPSHTQSRDGGIAIDIQSFQNFDGSVNLTASSLSGTRVFLGAIWAANNYEIMPYWYETCDLQVAIKQNSESNFRENRNAKTLVSRVKSPQIASSNETQNFNAAPIFSWNGTNNGLVQYFAHNSSQLALGLQLFPYTVPRQAKASVRFCTTKASQCDTCSDPTITMIASNDTPFIIPYSGPIGAGGETYCANITLTDTADGSSSIMGGAILGDVADVKAVLV